LETCRGKSAGRFYERSEENIQKAGTELLLPQRFLNDVECNLRAGSRRLKRKPEDGGHEPFAQLPVGANG